MKKISIVYQGGSGGFFLYYYFLLSGNYQYSIKKTWNLINLQFSTIIAENRKNWKKDEIWPNNMELINSTNPSVMLICNPLFCPDAFENNKNIIDNSYSILLKTNFRAQLRMSFEKQSYWFTEVSKKHFSASENNKEYIRKIISTSNNGYDSEILNILNSFKINQVVDIEKFIKAKKIENFPNPNIDQLKWIDYWFNLQSKKSQRLLLK